MYINGIGIVFNRGRGVAALENALEDGWQPPALEEGRPVYRVAAETLKDKITSGALRRADRFTKMAVLAAHDAMTDSGLDQSIDKADLGIIGSTYFGPHVTTFHFLDEILDYGHKGVSAIAFSHSVHNSAVSYVALSLECRGPTLTLTDFSFPFQSALLTAKMWLSQERCDHVLAGYVEECGKVMEYACSQKLNLAVDGKIKSLDFSAGPVAVPGETAIFFLLSDRPAKKSYGKIEKVDFSPPGQAAVDLLIVAADGSTKDESGYRQDLKAGRSLAGYSALAGSFAGGSAFNCAVAALTLKNQTIYPVPFADVKSGPAQLKQLACLRYDCPGSPAVVELQSCNI